MDATIAQSAWWLQAYAWVDARKKPLLWAGGLFLLVGIVIAYYFWNRAEKEVAASEALSAASAAQAQPGRTEKADGYLKVAAEFPGTSGAAQALLRAGAVLFAESKFAEAQTQFERFLRDHRENPLASQAMFGVAACLEAQGKTAEAVERYKLLIERRSGESVIPQAKLALAGLYEKQQKPEAARNLYEDVARTSPFSSLGSQAALRLEALLEKHPALASAPAAATNTLPLRLNQP